ncbi:hypothetical protein NDU88_004465 [Pleurodeles waltl]|uniref:Uncharacterized protein n=1 Tax=Pleurodeles waltl TaxID=8319 RepID=A0AAV7RLN2_PLEWA|nr:hypothetical protein NDU88_004465 [Pleurodeles waltl]
MAKLCEPISGELKVVRMRAYFINLGGVVQLSVLSVSFRALEEKERKIKQRVSAYILLNTETVHEFKLAWPGKTVSSGACEPRSPGKREEKRPAPIRDSGEEQQWGSPARPRCSCEFIYTEIWLRAAAMEQS